MTSNNLNDLFNKIHHMQYGVVYNAVINGQSGTIQIEISLNETTSPINYKHFTLAMLHAAHVHHVACFVKHNITIIRNGIRVFVSAHVTYNTLVSIVDSHGVTDIIVYTDPTISTITW